MALAETELEVRAWLDRLAIQDLIFRYSDALTRADLKQFAPLFVLDLIWEIPKYGLRYESAAAFLEMLAGLSTSDVLIQTPHAPVVNLIDSRTAQASTTIHEWSRMISPVDATSSGLGTDVHKGQEVNQEEYGIYFDDIARIDGEWKFTHRLYVPLYNSTGCVTGDVLTPRSQLLRST
jgi:hypothetical protein